MSTLKLMKMLMIILILFSQKYGIWRYSMIHRYLQRCWCSCKKVVWIKTQFRLCDQTTKSHIQRQCCVKEQRIELIWNVHYSQFIKLDVLYNQVDIFFSGKKTSATPPSLALLACVFLPRELTNFPGKSFSSSGYVGNKSCTCTLAHREQNFGLVKWIDIRTQIFVRKLDYSNNIVNMVLLAI